MRNAVLLVLIGGLAACAQANLNGAMQGDDGAGGGGGGAGGGAGGGGGGGGGGGSGMQPDAQQSGSCAQAFTGTLGTWSFASEPGSQASTSSSGSAPGVTAGEFKRSSGLTTSTGANSINSANWATSAQLDPSKYYTATITPPSGCTMSITGIGIDAKASATGPASGAVATDADNFQQTSPVDTNSQSSPSLSVSAATGAVEIRIYGYGASGTSGTFRVQTTFTVSGSLQ
ncbi:MAG TPA: hypothetical protein VLX92_29385 [Kofleriaceae bacterium]|nr:hypothetical protein [Kofleriaceae bacterium]